ncbi:MAG: hypothetical protein P9M14_04080 [Candidatus Alcyoniella australis]|nr:hypothetical protein [Candidatus Alcyoniella australis]
MRTATTLGLIALLTLAIALPAMALTREHRCQVYFGPNTSEVFGDQVHGSIRDLMLVWDSSGLKNISFFISVYGKGELEVQDILYVEDGETKWKMSDRKRGLPIMLSHTNPSFRETYEEKLFIFGSGPIDYENSGKIVFQMKAGELPFEMYWEMKSNHIFSPMIPDEECPDAKQGDQLSIPDAEPSPPVTDYK